MPKPTVLAFGELFVEWENVLTGIKQRESANRGSIAHKILLLLTLLTVEQMVHGLLMVRPIQEEG